MTPDRWQAIERLYYLALEARDAAARAALLDRACAGDADLRDEVESLLAQPPPASAFMAAPALDVVAASFAARPASLTGVQLGPYAVLDLLGAGGMGEVYKARDTRLGRDVAIKTLPPYLSRDPARRQRFEREARAISALNHPNICAIHDIGHERDLDFLVLEYVDGATLDARIARGPLPLDEALRIGLQLADALKAAHAAGIVHRDLKPANVVLTRSGAKLLDFGIAKLTAPPTDADQPSVMTAPPSLTAEGSVVGTVHYMAPEQIEGRAVDARSDIFAFGVLLYEMITGAKAFAGKTHASVIAAILEREPPRLTTLQPAAPAALERLVLACLAKQPEDRWQSAADIRRELAWIAADISDPLAVGASSSGWARRGTRLAWAAAAIASAIALVIGGLWLSAARDHPPQLPMRFTVWLPDNLARTAKFPAISPDGRHLVFLRREPGKTESLIWVRSIDSVDVHLLSGTEGAQLPFWSADSRSIGFFAEEKLKRVDLATGVIQTVCSAPAGRGGAWNADGVILFSPSLHAALFRVSAGGGIPTQVTRPGGGPEETSHRLPSFLSDGRHFVFTQIDSRNGNSIRLGSLDSVDTVQLVAPPLVTQASVQSGYLLFARDGALLAQPFDEKHLRLTGEAVPVVDHVEQDDMSHVAFSASETGALIYRAAARSTRQLTWMTRSGARLGDVWEPGPYTDMALSPDDRRLAVCRDSKAGDADIWVVDLSRGSATQTTSGHDTSAPVWSPDGAHLVFARQTTWGLHDLYMVNVDGRAAEELVLESNRSKSPATWSPDGSLLLFGETTVNGGGADLLQVPMRGAPRTSIVPIGGGRPWDVQFSPDGRWIAFVSVASGTPEVFVQGFPTGPRVHVSTAGGWGPHWRKDGRELFYVSSDWKLMAVDVGSGATFEPGAIAPLFDLPQGSSYVVTGDGQRFLVQVPQSAATAPPLTIFLNWKPAARH